MADKSTREQLEKSREKASELREENKELAKAAGKNKGLAKRLAETADKALNGLKSSKEQLKERDSVERSIVVSLASSIGAGVTTAALNAGLIDYLAKKSAWVAQRKGYLKGIPHAVLGYAVVAGELATRGKPPVSMGREIVGRAGELFGTLGVSQVISTWWEKRQAQQVVIQAALQAQQQPAPTQ